MEELKEDLKKANERAESIIESSIDGIVTTDTAGSITRVNKAFCKLLGYSQQELIGKHMAEINPLEGEEYLTTYGQRIKTDKNYIDHIREQVFKYFTKGEGYIKSYLVRKDKILVPVITSSYWMTDKEGQRQEGVSIVRDITERKLSESKLNKAYQEVQESKDYLENIFSTSVDGIVITDPQGIITKANEAVEKMTGYTEEELKGMHTSQLSSCIDDESYKELRKNMVDKLFKDGRVMGLEMVWEGKDGG